MRLGGPKASVIAIGAMPHPLASRLKRSPGEAAANPVLLCDAKRARAKRPVKKEASEQFPPSEASLSQRHHARIVEQKLRSH